MLIGLGAAARDSVAAFGEGGIHAHSAEVIADLLAAARPAVVLVKGSRFMRMERVVAGFSALIERSVGKEPGDAA